MIWYEYLGGSKAYQALIAVGCGIMAWFTIPIQARVNNLFQFLLYWAACMGIYGFYRIKETRIKNGKNGGG